MTTDPLAALRANAKPPVVRDRKDRLDATTSPDARKARDIVKAVASTDDPGSVTLTEIALKIAAVTADPAVRDLLKDRAEAFQQATEIYQREELQASRPIAWLGQDTTGNFYGVVPPGTSEHKMMLVAAWGAMLRAVNEATKVGVQKRSKYAPITLLVDVDAAPIAGPTPEWN